MDIAKIRKKAKEQEGNKLPEVRPEPAATVPEEPVLSGPAPEIREEETQGTLPQPAPGPTAQEAPEEVGQSGEKDRIEMLTFRLATEEFAFRVAEVEEILRPQNITKVPSMPSYMQGITSLRGKIIPVLDLKARLNLNRAAPAGPCGHESGSKASEGKILIIDGPKGFIGAAVDSVMGVVGVVKDEILEPPAHLTEAEMKFIEGIVILDKRFISVINSADTIAVEIG